MTRPLRIEYAGAVYHVMARGNQGRAIFQDDRDRKRCLETLAESCERADWLIHAYVLMDLNSASNRVIRVEPESEELTREAYGSFEAFLKDAIRANEEDDSLTCFKAS